MVEKHKNTARIENDEIDFNDLFLVLKKRFRLILGIFVIVVFFAGVISFLIPPVYQSDFIVRVPIISTKVPVVFTGETQKLIKELDMVREEERFRELSEKLGIKEEKAKEIVSLASTPSKEPKDKKFLEITVNVKDPLLINKLKEGILNFLNQNRYISERVSRHRNNLIYLRKEIQTKITEIEEFKNILTAQIKKGTRKDLGFNPMIMGRDVIHFKRQLRDLENEIQLLGGFEVVVEPFIPEEPVRPKKVLYIAIAGITSLFMGVLLAFFMEWAERNKKVPE